MCFFFFNDTATTEIYTLSLHDALPISDSDGDGFALLRMRPAHTYHPGMGQGVVGLRSRVPARAGSAQKRAGSRDRKSTRLNSSHANISYAVFCLKKKHCSPYLLFFICT